MALILLEGFDHFTSDDHLVDKGWTGFLTQYVDISSTYGRFGGNGLQSIHSNSGQIKKSIGVDKSTIYFGMAIKKESLFALGGYSSIDRPMLEFFDESSVSQVKIHVDSGYGLSAYRGTTLLGSSGSDVFETDKWFYLEGKITISDTVGEVTLKIGETQILNLTSQDTKAGSAYIRNIGLCSMYHDVYTYFDDLYIDDSQFHGDCRVRTFMPDADGNSADFTRSTGSNDYECVDENPSTEDTDYISSNTLNHKSIFGITTGALGTVKGIQINNHLRDDAAGVRKIKTIVRSNSTDYQGTETDAIPADYTFEHEIWELDPDDSGAWTQTKLEAAEFGLEITT